MSQIENIELERTSQLANAPTIKGNPLDLKEASISQGISTYLDVMAQVERMHRLLLDVIKDEFTRMRILDINPVQGLLLYNIGISEVSAGELRTRGYYQGSNVSYNLRKLVDTQFMKYERNESDRRSVRVCLSKKGQEIHNIIRDLFARLFSELVEKDIWSLSDTRQTRDNLMLLERYWSDQIRYIY